MNSWRHQWLRRPTIWLLLVVFGLPATFGEGLHVLLPHPNESPCRSVSVCACCGAPNADVSPLGGAASCWFAAGDTHDPDGCFLCRFLIRLHSAFCFAPVVLFFLLWVGRANILRTLRFQTAAAFYSGRGPPVSVVVFCVTY